MKKIALLFGFMAMGFAATSSQSSPSPTDETTVEMAADADDEVPADDEGGGGDEDATCAPKGETCLTKGAPRCCRGLRCVGYVCKK